MRTKEVNAKQEQKGGDGRQGKNVPPQRYSNGARGLGVDAHPFHAHLPSRVRLARLLAAGSAQCSEKAGGGSERGHRSSISCAHTEIRAKLRAVGRPEALVVGAISRDLDVTRPDDGVRPGGVVYYAGAALARLGAQTCVLTTVRPDDAVALLGPLHVEARPTISLRPAASLPATPTSPWAFSRATK